MKLTALDAILFLSATNEWLNPVASLLLQDVSCKSKLNLKPNAKLVSQGVVTGVLVLLVAAGAGVSFLQAVNAIIGFNDVHPFWISI